MCTSRGCTTNKPMMSPPHSGISPPSDPPVVSNLSCTSYSSNNGEVAYASTFNTTADCPPQDSAAVKCSKYNNV